MNHRIQRRPFEYDSSVKNLEYYTLLMTGIFQISLATGQKKSGQIVPIFLIFYNKSLMAMTVFVFFSVTVPLIMSMAIVFMDLFISFKHGNDMCHGCMSKCGKVEMDDHESTEEYPQEDMDQIYNLHASDEIDSRFEQFWIPEEKAGNQLERDEQYHDHEV